MKVYSFKCESCGAKRYEKTDDGYKCEYCGNVQEVITTSKPEVKEPESNNNNKTQTVQLDAKQKSILVRLLICIFAGYFGVHKFFEGKIFVGIIYAITGGLFGVGVFIDVIKYILKLVESKHTGGEY